VEQQLLGKTIFQHYHRILSLISGQPLIVKWEDLTPWEQLFWNEAAKPDFASGKLPPSSLPEEWNNIQPVV